MWGLVNVSYLNLSLSNVTRQSLTLPSEVSFPQKPLYNRRMDDEEKVNYFAVTDSRNKRVPFGIKNKDRSRHVYVIGKTGMGKSTLLENMAIQDIRNGHGLAFVDPHGKSADFLLDYVPQERIKDVLYFAPFDMEYPISFNVMEDVGADRRHLVANGLMSTFEKIWVDAWSARMAYILNNTLLALLEYPGSTLLGINRMLSDKDYRKKVVDSISDPSVKAFWVDEFARYTDRYTQEATPAIQNKVGQFTANPLIRNIVGQPRSSFDLRKMMDERKIVIVNLSKGRVGEGNANLLGSMFITKIYLAAMSRADVSESNLRELPSFFLFVDEFQSFANKSFAYILSEARKYKLNLTIAHQYIEQMEEEVRAAVFGNVGTMLTFRVGAYDAEVLEKEFAPQFNIEDLVNLGFAQIYLKLMINGVSSSPFSATTLPPMEKSSVSFKSDIIENSRRTYARPRAEVETAIKAWHEKEKKEEYKGEKILMRQTVERTPTIDRPESLKPRAPRTDEHRHREAPIREQKDREQNHHWPRQREPVPFRELGGFHRAPRVREPDPKHRKELREALSSILKTEDTSTTQTSQEVRSVESSSPPTLRGASQIKPREEISSEKVKERPQINEKKRDESSKEGVPEEVLRKLLEVSGEES